MGSYTRSFLKILPSLREYTMEVIRQNPVLGKCRKIPVQSGEIEIYIHPASRPHAPVLFEFHGGGLVLGDAAKDDHLCERIKEELNITVIGVNYRKAPEYPYPTAWQDAYDAVSYVHSHSTEFAIDPGRMAVLGFSGGATLATILAMKAAQTGEFSLACQILHYPYVDGASHPASKKHHPADLPIEVMEAFTELYGNGEDPKKADISPLYATNELLKGSAPAALFMAGEDALREEGFAYAARLVQAGVPVIVQEAVPEMHHGYMEDYFNQPCYKSQPEDTLALHSPKMPEMAEAVLKKTEVILAKYLFEEKQP
ncbi:MAG: alpha/beta hydrolase [Enterocloster citroniae]|nr:alpha/beta hydrolase [Enterocloster citroniae]